MRRTHVSLGNRIPAISGMVALSALIAVLWASLSSAGLEKVDKVASAAGAGVGVASLLVSTLGAAFLYRKDRKPLSGLDLQAASDLAVNQLLDSVRIRWLTEARSGALPATAPLRIVWEATPDERASWTNRYRRSVTSTKGDQSHLVDFFESLPSPGLVILGPPGSGKTTTAIMLTLALADRASDSKYDLKRSPVPVLLSPSTWAPRFQAFEVWLEDEMVKQYPSIREFDSTGSSIVKRLIRDGAILPILDGLDELSPTGQAWAWDALDRWRWSANPLIVTSRTNEFEEAVNEFGLSLNGMTVVTLKPPFPNDISEFLLSGYRGDAWASVLQRIRSNPSDPLAKALSSPLNVSLANSAYRARDRSPNDLLRLSTEDEILNHLVMSTLEAAHSDAGPRLGQGLVSPLLGAYSPQDAMRWLSFLARDMEDARRQQLAWWELARAVPRIVPAVFTGLVTGISFMSVMLVAPQKLWTVGLSLGGGFVFALYSWFSLQAQKLPSPRGIFPRFSGSISKSITNALPTALVWSVVVGVAAGSADKLATGAWAGVSTFLPLLLILGLLNQSITADGRVLETTPLSVLKADRTAGLAEGWVVGAIIFSSTLFVISHVQGGLDPAILSLCLALSGAVTTVVLRSAWGRFCVTRVWLSINRRTPLRLIFFLEEAWRAGLLRKAGSHYLFRHARLAAILTGSRYHAQRGETPRAELQPESEAHSGNNAFTEPSRSPQSHNWQLIAQRVFPAIIFGVITILAVLGVFVLAPRFSSSSHSWFIALFSVAVPVLRLLGPLKDALWSRLAPEESGERDPEVRKMILNISATASALPDSDSDAEPSGGKK